MIISIKQLVKWYGSQLVLHDLSYELTEPAMIALVAPNGSGKTTLLNIMCGLEHPSSGEVEIFGEKPDWQQFKRVGFMQDNSVLFSHLTGRDHLAFVAGNHGLGDADILAVTESLKMTSYLDKKVSHYSLGMKQHLLFALAILPKPELLLLDEPLNGLDPASIVRVRELMVALHHDQQTTIIFSSHNLDQIDKLTDQIMFLKEGEIVDSTPRSVDYQFVLADLEPLEAYLVEHDQPYTVISRYKLSCRLTENELLSLETHCLTAGLTIFDRTQVKMDAERIYFDLFREEEDGA